MRLAAVLLLSASFLKSSHISVCLTDSFPTASIIGNERRGCCSHHGGVCGCEKGRTVCCDGNFSPTCGC